jgi:hypothetical protein
MIDIDKFMLKSGVEDNPLIRIHLNAMKYFGYILFDYQKWRKLQCFRGVLFTVSFVIFNMSQVNIYFNPHFAFNLLKFNYYHAHSLSTCS